MNTNIKSDIINGKTSLGIELGSTRIKAILLDSGNNIIANGFHDWENKFENNIWTYSKNDIWKGIQECFSSLKEDVLTKYQTELTKIGSMGVSAMMHGYIALDENDEFLVPFRTWRNTITGVASSELTKLFNFNIPQRWSIAHLYQAMLNKEEHLPQISYLTTLSGYVHYMLTGEKVLGIGDASGMFPINDKSKDYDTEMLSQFDEKLCECNLPYKLINILPKVLKAGEIAGKLTKNGAELLDISKTLEAGTLMCPPEGDAGTGMVATNSISKSTGNISAGTSIFAMIVLEKNLSKVYEQIDIVTTPSGLPVAMVHCNNCTSDIDAWADIFKEFANSIGISMTKGKILDKMFELGQQGDADCGGLLAYNYYSGEHITEVKNGRPMFVRTPNSKFTVQNFMRTHLYSAISTLKIGMNILINKENVKINKLLGHGGFFKADVVGQEIVAAAMNTSVSVMTAASEGGAYGMALLAAYLNDNSSTLEDFLSNKIFANCPLKTVNPNADEVKGFNSFLDLYESGLEVQKTASDRIKE